MDRIPFKQLPTIVRIAVWLVFNNAWWSLEGQRMCLGLGCRHNHSTGCMARVRRPDAVHGALMPARAGYSVAGRKCTARAVLAGKV